MSTRRDFLLQTAATVTAVTAAPGTGLEAESGGRSEKQANGVLRGKDPKTKALRLAIVGTGEISPRYLKQAAESTQARFVATCARTIESAKARGIEYGIDNWFTDYRKMFDTVKPDGVVIATPDALHAEQSIAALERGIHVLCEKPMATRWDDCEAMMAAARSSSALLLSLPYDATPSFLAALAHANEETLGVFTGAQAQMLLPGGARDAAYDPKESSGAMLSTLVYSVSRLVNLLGPVVSVSGLVNTLLPHRLLGDGTTLDMIPPPRNSRRRVQSAVDDNSTLIIEWESGQQAVLRCLWGTSILSINEATVYGRHGTLWFGGRFGQEVVIHSPERAIPGAEVVTWRGYENCYRIPVAEQKNEGLIEHFVDCIERRSEPRCGAAQSLHVHEIIFKGQEAARSGKRHELKTTFTPWHKIDPAFHDTRSRFV